MTHKKIIIFAPSYNENIGGVIALHKLCHILNSINSNAYLMPYFETKLIYKNQIFISLLRVFKSIIKNLIIPYKTNAKFNTPVIAKKKIDYKKDIIIYPDITIGNPLNLINVVRWFLYYPGIHNGQTLIGIDDLIVDYNDFLTSNKKNYNHYPNNLCITHFPLELYNENECVEPNKRYGTAYCVRKASITEFIHPKDSICIDGLTHKEISLIFKKVKTFISYDLYTAYSRLAILCGADSIIIPKNGIDELEWHKNEEDRFGLAYGFERLDYSRKTREMAILNMKRHDEIQVLEAKKFLQYLDSYFK